MIFRRVAHSDELDNPFGLLRMMTHLEEGFINGNQKKMVLVAHPDDESIAASIFLQRQRSACVVFATSGGYATTEKLQQLALEHTSQYAHQRTEEAMNALSYVPTLAGVHFLQFPDGQLHQYLSEFFKVLSTVVRRSDPDIILTHAREAQHLDHDACSFVASQIRTRLGIRVWEMPLYHSRGGRIVAQQFMESNGEPVVEVLPTALEVEVKRRMLRCHRTQEILGVFRGLGIDPARPERFRQQRERDDLDYYPGLFGRSPGL